MFRVFVRGKIGSKGNWVLEMSTGARTMPFYKLKLARTQKNETEWKNQIQDFELNTRKTKPFCLFYVCEYKKKKKCEQTQKASIENTIKERMSWRALAHIYCNYISMMN